MAKNVLSFNISPKSPDSTTLTEILANQPCHVPLCCHGRQLSHASCTVDRRQDMSLLVTHTAEHMCTVQMSLSHITSHHITPHHTTHTSHPGHTVSLTAIATCQTSSHDVLILKKLLHKTHCLQTHTTGAALHNQCRETHRLL